MLTVGRGGVAKCQHLSTRGRVRVGVKNTQNPVNVVYECPLYSYLFGVFSVPDALIRYRTFNYFFDLSFQDIYNVPRMLIYFMKMNLEK